MLTRLKVRGFKNLVDVDVRFGPFTCVAGANGVGKSNLLDAITFLSTLADEPIFQAAMKVRSDDDRQGDLTSIFHAHGHAQEQKMSFEAELIIPRHGFDDLGQEAEATSTFVRYSLDLSYRPASASEGNGPRIEIEREELRHIRAGEVGKALGFKYSKEWLESTVRGIRYSPFYISTSGDPLDKRTISIHQDKGGGGRVRRLLVRNLPRTALSASNAIENPTATLVRREMKSWKRLQLEPSALRKPDSFTARTSLGEDGSNLPATIYQLSNRPSLDDKSIDPERVYSSIVNRLGDLIDDVRELRIDRDEKRSLLTLQVAGRDGSFHPAKSLSDGTLRFLALAVIELDPNFQGLICLEEPENGIHPARIPAILRLLRDIAVDTRYAVDADNPLRQVLVNTHSPLVVAQIPDDSLLMAQSVSVYDTDCSYDKVDYSALEGTWRTARAETASLPIGRLLDYLGPLVDASKAKESSDGGTQASFVRVIDNPAIQMMLFRGEG
jgi:predicted ATPase